MTHEELFNKLKESPVFKAIDQTQSIMDFLLARTAEFVAVDCSEELQQLQKQKQQYEAEFKKRKFKNLPRYRKVIKEMELESEFLYFQQGFFEGFKFIFIMGQFSILPESYLNYLDSLEVK